MIYSVRLELDHGQLSAVQRVVSELGMRNCLVTHWRSVHYSTYWSQRAQRHYVTIRKNILMEDDCDVLAFLLALSKAETRAFRGTIQLQNLKGGHAFWEIPFNCSLRELVTRLTLLYFSRLCGIDAAFEASRVLEVLAISPEKAVKVTPFLTRE